MTIKEVKALKPDELEAKLKELKNELMNLRFQNSINQLANPMRITEVKKSIARIMTVIRENEIANDAQ